MRDALPEISAKEVAVLGISPDMPADQKHFDDTYSLGFPLLSDDDHQIAEAYGVWGEQKYSGKTYLGILRSAFLIDETGRLSACWYNISPSDTVPKLMSVI